MNHWEATEVLLLFNFRKELDVIGVVWLPLKTAYSQLDRIYDRWHFPKMNISYPLL